MFVEDKGVHRVANIMLYFCVQNVDNTKSDGCGKKYIVYCKIISFNKI